MPKAGDEKDWIRVCRGRFRADDERAPIFFFFPIGASLAVRASINQRFANILDESDAILLQNKKIDAAIERK